VIYLRLKSKGKINEKMREKRQGLPWKIRIYEKAFVNSLARAFSFLLIK